MIDAQNEPFREKFGSDFPHLADLAAKSPLVFVNSEELLDFPRPILHKIVYIGGVVLENPQPLSQVSLSCKLEIFS